MTTIHATAKKVSGGFAPMVIVRNERGQVIGSRVCKARVLRSHFVAAFVARLASKIVAAKSVGVQVAGV